MFCDRPASIEAMTKTATALSVEIIEVPARSPDEFEGAIALAFRHRADGLVVLDDSQRQAGDALRGHLKLA